MTNYNRRCVNTLNGGVDPAQGKDRTMYFALDDGGKSLATEHWDELQKWVAGRHERILTDHLIATQLAENLVQPDFSSLKEPSHAPTAFSSHSKI